MRDELRRAVDRLEEAGLIVKHVPGARQNYQGGRRSKDSICLECLKRECIHMQHARVLTPRQQQILRLLSLGLSDQHIADRMLLSRGTVKIYTTRMYQVLGVESRLQAALWARDHMDVLNPPPAETLPAETVSESWAC